MLLTLKLPSLLSIARFNGHPPWGVNATNVALNEVDALLQGFNGHPPLGVNATQPNETLRDIDGDEFQWAPTLGGECYLCGLSDRMVWSI